MEATARLILDVYDSAQHCMPHEFSEFALSGFRKCVPFESAVLTDLAVGEDRKLAVHAAHLHMFSPDRINARVNMIGVETLNRDGTINSRDAAFKSAFAVRGRTVIRSVADTFADPDILAYCKKYDTAHSMTLLVERPGHERFTAVSFWRAARRNGFGGMQGRAADSILPHLLQAREINKRLSVASLRPSETTVLAGLDGRMFFVEDDAIRLLQLEWAQWTPPVLPAVLLDALRRDQARTYRGGAISVKAREDSGMLSLTIARHQAGVRQLTAAEYRIALLAGQGLQYKEIARQAGVSPATVRNQLHAVYDKLGVANKTALAAVLRT